MEVLVLADKPWHDPAAQWNCGIRGERLLLLVGSERDRVFLSLTQEEVKDMLARWAVLLAQSSADAAP